MSPTVRIIEVRNGEVAQLKLGFLRFVELHGRAVADPASGCSMAMVDGADANAVILTFWSARAAAAFDVFWRRYRLIFDVPPDASGFGAA